MYYMFILLLTCLPRNATDINKTTNIIAALSLSSNIQSHCQQIPNTVLS